MKTTGWLGHLQLLEVFSSELEYIHLVHISNPTAATAGSRARQINSINCRQGGEGIIIARVSKIYCMTVVINRRVRDRRRLSIGMYFFGGLKMIVTPRT